MSDLRTLMESLHCHGVEFRRFQHASWGWRVYLMRKGEHEVRLDDAWNGWPMVALVATCDALGLFYEFAVHRCHEVECDHCWPTLPGHMHH